MTFGGAISNGFNNYANFSDRASRSEFWWWFVFLLLVNAVAGAVDAALHTGGLINGLASLALLIPNIAVAARRLHDLDRSGWWQLLVLVPVIGFLVLLFWFVSVGTAGPNRFGNDPLDGNHA